MFFWKRSAWIIYRKDLKVFPAKLILEQGFRLLFFSSFFFLFFFSCLRLHETAPTVSPSDNSACRVATLVWRRAQACQCTWPAHMIKKLCVETSPKTRPNQKMSLYWSMLRRHQNEKKEENQFFLRNFWSWSLHDSVIVPRYIICGSATATLATWYFESRSPEKIEKEPQKIEHFLAFSKPLF